MTKIQGPGSPPDHRRGIAGASPDPNKFGEALQKAGIERTKPYPPAQTQDEESGPTLPPPAPPAPPPGP